MSSLYFAYGSNLHTRQFSRRCPGAQAIGRARLPDYRLAFTRYSTKRRGGVADIVPEAGGEVWGALYEVEDYHLASLDEFENAPRSYRRELLWVFDDAGAEREAFAYIANKTGTFAPSRAYLGLIVKGARAHGLPEEYVLAVERVRTYA